MLSFFRVRHSLLTVTFTIYLHIVAFAQLKADFTLDKASGCSPLAISFANTSTGISSTATYEWNFDNGNSSSLKNPGAVFREEKQYNITLTIKDGNQISTKTQIVTVYKKPSVDFISSSQKGCAPFPVTFTSTSAPGDGTITDYFWDFGDGITQSGTNSQITHLYLFEQKPIATLTVTNSYGCSNTKKLIDAAEILPGVKASFDANKTFLCRVSDNVILINKSSGTGALSYEWDFGDGNKSTEKNPTYSFNTKGTFTVQLAVRSSLGCVDTLKKTGYLNVADFKSEFLIPQIVCKESEIELKNSSTPTPSNSSWLIDGIYPVNPDWYGAFKYRFTSPGMHTIQLSNAFGDCTESITRQIDVKDLLQPKGFIVEIPGYCFPPAKVNFRDTTSGAVKSEWNFERLSYPLSPQATGQTASYTFTQPNNWVVTLFVTDANGCRNSVEQVVTISQPIVRIETTDNNALLGCTSLTKKFKIITNEQLTSFTWVFDNGATSTEPEPEHTFPVGFHGVKLKYTTAKGCTGESYFPVIEVFEKPKADFVSLSGTTICGNSITWFERQTDYRWPWDYWLVDGEYAGSAYYGRLDYQFKDTGKHTVSLILYNDGCRDTMTKVDYITVLPPFPKISEAKNTCDDDRGMVTFKQTSRYAEKWIWDFGDGNTISLDADQGEITHHYTKSGEYMVYLTTTNGSCSLKDSIRVSVLMKQHPLLSAAKTEICMDEGLKYTLTNLEKNTYSGAWVYYYIDSYEYNDGTAFSTGRNSYDDFDNWITWNDYSNTFKNVEKNKDQIRVITKQVYYNCLDTSNYIPIKVIGGVAGFEPITNNICFKIPVVLKDTSNAYNSTIQSWQWNFGDGHVQSLTQGGIISHTYANPGMYNVTLKVTDASGCSSTTSSSAQAISVNGPKASFSSSGSNVSLNTTVQFYNNTNNFNSNATQYEWDFGDGSTSGESAPAHVYGIAGDYIVRLIAKNLLTGCADTAIQKISVQNFNVSFSFTKSFLNNSKCPPALVQFINSSVNYTSIKWDFGDGSTSQNIERPTHIYTQPGKYIVQLSITGDNGLSGTYIDSVVIKQPTVNVTADILRSCTAQSVTVSAINENASSYVWDFGDGTITQATDTFSTHYYSKAGNYTPQLIAKDANGCAASVTLNDKIIIDSLYLSLNNLPQKICTPKEIVFNPTIVNIAADQAQQNLIYHWDFGTGAAEDTSDIKTPSFTYQQPGTYTVSLKVESPFGCVKESKTTIVAYQGLGGQINGPSEICEDATVQFTGATQLQGQPQWKWIFDDGSIVTQQNPPAKAYKDAGTFIVKLLVDNNGCTDTISKLLLVHTKPIVSLSSKQAVVCEGTDVSILAGGGISYSWTPATGLNDINSASIIAAPVVNTTYTVSVINSYGCINTDSVKITVTHPFKMNLASEAVVCKGKTIELKSSGAATYQWIGNTNGLNNTAIANPLATPAETSTYTVSGTDKDNCFTDTASIQVLVKPVPNVDAGQSVEILMGSPHQLQPTASSDVQTWSWSPSKYLSCTTCKSPEAKPVEPMNYQVTVTNAFGCTATDTVSIKLFCSESRIYIPNSFTPNNDGVNDRFSIKGQGIRIVKYLGIYNRWGELVFERSNFQVDDKNGAWDGRFKGLLAPTGSYVYFAEMSCNEKTFTQKGTVTVVY